MNRPDRYMTLFLEESRDLLRQGEECLVAMERTPDLCRTAPLNRMWHSLKGMAAALGLEDLVVLAHAAEEGLPTPAMSPEQRHAALDGQAEAMQTAARLLAALQDGHPVPDLSLSAHSPAPASRKDTAQAGNISSDIPAPPPAPPMPDTLRVPVRELDALLADVVGLEGFLAAGDGHTGAATRGEDRLPTARCLAGMRHRLARLRHLPFATIVPSLESLVLTGARRLGSRAHLQVHGAEHRLERGTLELLAESLPHLLRNALAHGIEPKASRRQAKKPERGLLRIRIEPRRGRVRVVVEDDGRGVDLDALRTAVGAENGEVAAMMMPDADLAPLLCRPGLSTARVTDVVAGRGIGLDAVRERLARAGGGLSIHRRAECGTRVILEIPATLAVTTCLVARIGHSHLGFPLPGIRGLEALPTGATGRGGPLERLLAGATSPPSAGHALELALRGQGDRSYTLQVDQIMGRLQAVVRPLPGLKAGSAILGTAVWKAALPVLILDPAILFLHLPRSWADEHSDSEGGLSTGSSPAAG
ncbi:MAG: ATP-binding protein [Acidobacteria bacterium]|nr:ATP-binding protein [Acidobacteriota bacterium]